MNQELVAKKKKKVLEKEVKEKEIVIMSLKEMSEKLKVILKSHIGRGNSITQKELFIKMFGNPSNYSDLQIFFLWDRTRKAMNWLRRTSYYFVISRRTFGTVYSYFIVRDYDDAKIYINHLDNVKKKINFMQNRCLKAVNEKFYKKIK